MASVVATVAAACVDAFALAIVVAVLVVDDPGTLVWTLLVAVASPDLFADAFVVVADEGVVLLFQLFLEMLIWI